LLKSRIKEYSIRVCMQQILFLYLTIHGNISQLLWPLIEFLCFRYMDFISNRVKQNDIVYSNTRMEISSLKSDGLNPELYTSENELEPLCELLGPCGIQFLDERLTRFMASQAISTKDMITYNSEPLQNLWTFIHDEKKSIEQLEKLKCNVMLLLSSEYTHY
jgi:hypothetical protein